MKILKFLLALFLAGAIISIHHSRNRSLASVHRCNPLGGGAGEDCFLPFPSSFYLRPDPKTATGNRVNLSQASLPISSVGTPLDPAPYNERDGFSTVGALLAYFPERIDPIALPDSAHSSLSLQKDSSVQLIRYDTGERVPVFAEIDANASSALHDKQAVVIQPMARLEPKTRYVAVIQSLRSISTHELIPPLSGFRALRDKIDPLPAPLESEKKRYEEIFGLLKRKGVERATTQLAWDFTTGSDEAIVGRMLKMRDQAQASQPQSRLVIEHVERNPKAMPELLMKISGTFSVPSFLESGNGSHLHRSAETGQPDLTGPADFPITIHVPQCAETATLPLPVIIYGHGTFNTAAKEMSSPYSREITNRLCMIEVGTDWLGRAKSDLPYFILKVLPNWNNFTQITDRLQQAHVNVLTLARLVRSGTLAALPQLQKNGHSLVDSQKIFYYGISEGGCQGVTTLALSPDIQRGALNVPCGFWSMFFWRSSDFYYPRRALRLSYPEAIEQQELMALSQLLWDYTDPANYGTHLLRDPLPGNETKKILYQEGINDASVPNLTTRAMVRTIGLKLLQPRIEAVYGIEEVSGPQSSAYVQYDVGSRPRLGGNNVPPETSLVHEQIRRLEAAKKQLVRFLRDDGIVEDTCGGSPCVFSN